MREEEAEVVDGELARGRRVSPHRAVENQLLLLLQVCTEHRGLFRFRLTYTSKY